MVVAVMIRYAAGIFFAVLSQYSFLSVISLTSSSSFINKFTFHPLFLLIITTHTQAHMVENSPWYLEYQALKLDSIERRKDLLDLIAETKPLLGTKALAYACAMETYYRDDDLLEPIGTTAKEIKNYYWGLHAQFHYSCQVMRSIRTQNSSTED